MAITVAPPPLSNPCTVNPEGDSMDPEQERKVSGEEGEQGGSELQAKC